MTNPQHSAFIPSPWWEEFPDFLREETERFAKAFTPPFTLYNDPRQGDAEGVPDYAKGRFVWRGSVSVRVHHARERRPQVHAFTLDFVYPEAYPYLRVKVISVEPAFRHARHQHPVDGSLCYMRENPNDWHPGVTNVQVLSRVKNWLLGHVTGWELAHHVDVAELPIYFHYDRQDSLNLFLFENCYVVSPGVGRMHLWIERKSRWDDKLVRGVVVGTENTRTREQLPLPTDREFPLDYFLNDPANAKRAQGVWFDLPKEPSPFHSARELVEIVSQAGHFPTSGEVTGFIKTNIEWDRYREGVYIGIRYPVREGARQWAVFRLSLPDAKPLPGAGISKKDRKRLKRTAQFEQAELRMVPTHPVRHIDLFRRVGAVDEVERLRARRVGAAGLGALGGPAVVLLAKAGVGGFELDDDDRLVVGNVTRHPSDLRDVPMPKCINLRAKIKAINPFATVAIGAKLTSASEVAGVLEKVDVLVVAIADEAIELLINAVAVKLRRTVFYARAMQQMRIGRVIRVTPGETACLVCLKQYREKPGVRRDANGSSWIDVPALVGGEVYDDGCGFVAVPGAAVDTEATANLLARNTVDWLLGRSGEVNHWVLVNRPATGTDDPRLTTALACHRQTFLPLEECRVCGAGRTEEIRRAQVRAEERRLAAEWHRVVLERAAYEMIAKESAQCGRLETGGVLLGRVDAETGVLVIRHATGPGPNAVHQEHDFLRDVQYCQSEIDRMHSESGGAIDYVGEWHRHREKELRLSSTDRGSLLGIAGSPSYHVARPVMLICAMEDFLEPDRHTIRAWTVGIASDKVEAVQVEMA